MAPQIKFGIYNPLEPSDWSDLLPFWRFLDTETLFHSVWVSDHLIPVLPGLSPAGPCLEAWTSVAAASQATDRLRLGVVATGVTLRQPAIIAKMAATIDHLSNGRLEFGLGTAWHGGEHAAYGIPFPSIKEREDMLEEAAQTIRMLFRAGAPVDFQGKHVQLRQAPFAPRCVQQPHVPIVIGGGGERRTLRTAARYGDIANVIGGAATARRKMAVLDQHCATAGRDPRDVTKSVIAPLALAANEDEARALRQSLALFSGGDPEGDVAIGRPDHVRNVINHYADAGVTYVMIVSRPPFDLDAYRRISDEIVAAFR